MYARRTCSRASIPQIHCCVRYVYLIPSVVHGVCTSSLVSCTACVPYRLCCARRVYIISNVVHGVCTSYFVSCMTCEPHLPCRARRVDLISNVVHGYVPYLLCRARREYLISNVVHVVCTSSLVSCRTCSHSRAHRTCPGNLRHSRSARLTGYTGHSRIATTRCGRRSTHTQPVQHKGQGC